MKPGISITEAAELFIVDMGSRGLAATTVNGRKSWARRFAKSCMLTYRERIDSKRAVCRTTDVDPSYVARFLKDGDYRQGNLNNALKALRAFCAYMERMRYIEKDGAEWLMGDRKGAKVERLPKYYIPAADFPRMLDLAEEWHGSDRAIMAIALYTLCRQSEIRDLTLSQVDLEGRTLSVRRSKRKRWTDVGMTPVLMAELLNWLAWYANEMGYTSVTQMMKEHPDWRLIPRRLYKPNQSEDGRFYRSEHRFAIRPEQAASHMEKIMKRVLAKLEAEGRHSFHTQYVGEGMHTVRRSGARAMYDHLTLDLGKDKALLFVSTLLDHESLEQTLLYIGVDEERRQLNEWLRENSPFAQDPAPSATVTVLPAARPLRLVEPLSGASAGDDKVALAQDV